MGKNPESDWSRSMAFFGGFTIGFPNFENFGVGVWY